MLHHLKQWLEDLRWAAVMINARRYRRRLGFSRRLLFDDAFRPYVSDARIAYPDALYHVKVDDLERALLLGDPDETDTGSH